MSQILDTERKNMAKILLGCLVGYMPAQGIAAVVALLDLFILLSILLMILQLLSISEMHWIGFMKTGNTLS